MSIIVAYIFSADDMLSRAINNEAMFAGAGGTAHTRLELCGHSKGAI